ncbi:uncharacterized protein LOC111518938 [Drosophila willistoni]|uniref:uncharacterized protein LOC111518938 n=1 Tax=Drosophila willistoni TaxID=7260 RepID=UPI00017D7E0E|nr:uncharacterized protein LOC111518938 [Drosophila willistoni]
MVKCDMKPRAPSPEMDVEMTMPQEKGTAPFLRIFPENRQYIIVVSSDCNDRVYCNLLKDFFPLQTGDAISLPFTMEYRHTVGSLSLIPAISTTRSTSATLPSVVNMSHCLLEIFGLHDGPKEQMYRAAQSMVSKLPKKSSSRVQKFLAHSTDETTKTRTISGPQSIFLNQFYFNFVFLFHGRDLDLMSQPPIPHASTIPPSDEVLCKLSSLDSKTCLKLGSTKTRRLIQRRAQ